MRYFYTLNKFLRTPFLTLLMIFSFNNDISGQCDNPIYFQASSISDSSVVFNWSSLISSNSYRISIKKENENWQFATDPINIPSSQSSIIVSGLDEFTTYMYRIKTFCSSGLSSVWSVPQQFTTTTNLNVDCNGILNGDAFIDDCGNCVGGDTGNEACIDFSPSITLSLSQLEPETLSDISFTISQDVNEPDMLSSVFVSDGGSFDFSSLSTSQLVGQGNASAGGGFLSSTFSLLVDFIIDDNNITLVAIDDDNGSLVGTFELQNSSTGVQVLSVAPQDGNNVTNGNNLEVTLSNMFLTPIAGELTFTSTITSEIEVVDNQEFSFEIGVTDCNGDFNGDAFIDDCGNCVGGDTGNEACIDFNPSILIELSSTDCNLNSDISFTISQSANQPDMSTSLLVTDGGSFNFDDFEVGQNVGSAYLDAAGGDVSFTAFLMITSFPSVNQAILSAVNEDDNSIMGSFTISNLENGISVVANPSYNDGNNVTNGNVSNLTLNGLFVNPDAQTLNFFVTTNSENDDTNSQTISLNIVCPCNLPGDANCDNIVNLADLTLVLNNWLQEVDSNGTNGDVVGSNDGFVNLSDLTLVLNNWLSVN